MSDAVEERFPEKRFQLAVVDWLSRHRGYVELFGDVEATGARVDSAGMRAGRALLIEFKLHVSLPMVRHADDRPGTLESKLAGVLSALYRKNPDPLSTAVNGTWDRSELPVFVIAAKSYSEEAERELTVLLSERADEWRFDWEVWKGCPPLLIKAGAARASNRSRDYDTIDIPNLIGRVDRPSRRTVVELGEVAATHGAGELFEYFVARVHEEGYRASTSSWVATFKRPGNLVACYPNDGMTGQLIVGVDQSLGDMFPRRVPVGYRKHIYVLTSPAEIDALLEAVAAS